VKADATASTEPEVPVLSSRPATPLVAATLLLLAFVAGIAAVALGHRFSASALIDLGPADARWVEGFRDLEKDGQIFFRWTSVPASRLTAPVRFCGPGSVRLRVRRHFVDPALLSVSLSGRTLGQRTVQARMDHPYEVINFQVLKVVCSSSLSVLLETSVENDRPLGVAIDWAEIKADAGFVPALHTLLLGGGMVAVLAVGLMLAGSPPLLSAAAALGLSLLIGLLCASDVLVAERLLRTGCVAGLLTLVLGGVLARLTRVRELVPSQRALMVAISALTLFSRLAFLHPQAFYPDYRVHALVQQTLDNLGLSTFLKHLFEIQYARSLGLQQIGEHWYPFPYPPGSYLLTSGVGGLFSLDPAESSATAAVVAAALVPMLTFGLGSALGVGPVAALGGALFVALHPLLVRRMALGYFPGLVGQFLDALALLLTITILRRPPLSPRALIQIGILLSFAFLVYTQSIVNFGLLIASLLALELVRRSDMASPVVALAVTGTVALSVSFGAFYWRYVPVMENVRLARPQAESQVLDRLDQVRRNGLPPEVASEAEDLNDPFAGTTVNPARGLARLGSRLWLFNGPFFLATVAGLWLLWRQSDRSRSNLLGAWALVAVWISVLAAGLPSPNGFQHLKDLEFVTPLLGLAFGAMAATLAGWRRGLGLGLSAAWLVFGAWRWTIEFGDRLVNVVGR